MKPKIKERYVDTGKVKVIWHNLPWIGAESRRAAEAAACAHEQGRFWPYQEKLFHNQRGYNRYGFSDENLIAHAVDVGLDRDQFATCLQEQRYAQAVADDFQGARDQGINSTPSFLVNGRKVVGAQPFERWADIIEAALKEKGS